MVGLLGMAAVNLNMHNQAVRRHFYFLAFAAVSILVFWTPLKTLVAFSLEHDYGSHILLIPVVSGYFIYLAKREVFAKVQFGFLAGTTLFLAGAILWWLAHKHSTLSGENAYFSLLILSVVLLWISVFIFFYGTPAFSAARFPLLLLLLMVPIPGFLLERIIFALQAGSAATAYWLFKLTGVPVFQQGFVLALPGINIEVVKECSGIRSSLALLLTALIVSELAFRSFWRKSVFVFSTLPILILKNGVRIVTVSLLSIYVDRAFLYGWLHKSGGIVFYLLGLLALVPIVMWLRRSERSSRFNEIRPAALASPHGSRVTVKSSEV
jgi:exosortase